MVRHSEKAAIALAAVATIWIVGAALFYDSGRLNLAGIVPTFAAAIATWGAITANSRLIWLGALVVAISSLLFLFSVGLALIPAAIALLLAAFLKSDRSALDGAGAGT